MACKELGRGFIGIKIDEQYYEIAKKRIDLLEELARNVELEQGVKMICDSCKHFRFIRGYARGVMDADPDELVCKCDDFAYLDENADECEMYEEERIDY